MTGSSNEQSLDSAYLVDFRPDEQAGLRRIINPRRGPTQSVPDLDNAVSYRLADDMFTKFGLEQYVGCVTGEMYQRPIPHVFREDETRALTELYKKWGPLIMERVISELEPPTQTYNKVSRLGWPDFTNPDNKRDVLAAAFRQIKAEGIEAYRRAFILINIRLQPEAREKSRTYQFIRNDGVVYEAATTQASRMIEVPGGGTRVASRTRLIFNMPIPNLYKQVLDTAIHNVFLRYPAFHHDMFNKKLLPVRGHHLCIDVKHFERFTASSTRARSMSVIGGKYGEIGQLFARIPFLVPSDDWTQFFYIKPNRDMGWSDQFASGDSAVAPVQKEIFTALYAEYFKRTRKLDDRSAISLVLNGGDERLTIRNYGDDNSLSGDETELKAVFAYLEEYLHVEEEVPPKFLGFEWTKEASWFLPQSSYLMKTYLNERRPFSNFRRYPNLGWVLKRDTYRQLGDPRIAEQIFPYEDVKLAAVGLPWSKIAWRAENERKQTLNTPGQRDVNWVLGKDYAMSAQDKLTTGEFIGYRPEETAPMIKDLLPQEWRAKLKW